MTSIRLKTDKLHRSIVYLGRGRLRFGRNPTIAEEPEAELPGFGETITPDFLHDIRQQLNREDKVALLATFQDVHEADIAELITLLSHDHRASFMRLVGSDIPAAVFAELDDGVRDEVVEYIDIDTLVATVQELDSDDAVFVLEDLDKQEQQEVLQKNLSFRSCLYWSAHWNFPKTVPDVWRSPNLLLCRRLDGWADD